MKKPRTFSDLINDPRVSNYSDERCDGICNDGLWLYLMPGWVYDNHTNTVHDFTVAECCLAMSYIGYQPEVYYDATHLPHEQRCLLPAG